MQSSRAAFRPVLNPGSRMYATGRSPTTRKGRVRCNKMVLPIGVRQVKERHAIHWLGIALMSPLSRRSLCNGMGCYGSELHNCLALPQSSSKVGSPCSLRFTISGSFHIVFRIFAAIWQWLACPERYQTETAAFATTSLVTCYGTSASRRLLWMPAPLAGKAGANATFDAISSLGLRLQRDTTANLRGMRTTSIWVTTSVRRTLMPR